MRTLAQIFQNDDPEEFLTRCAVDFKLFCTRVIQDPIDHSKGLSIMPFHMEWFDAAHNKRRSCILAPRGHGKSEILAVAYPIWFVFFNQHKEVMIISNSLEQSTKLLERIKMCISDNELLAQLEPTNKKFSWSKTEINTSTSCKIYTKPYNPNVKGSHVDYVLCDESSEYVDKDIFFRVISPIVNVKKGRVVCIGTPVSGTDLLARLQKNDKYWSNVYRAIKEDGTPLWPEKFSLKELNRIKAEIGSLTFDREYQCLVVGRKSGFIPMDQLVECLDDKLGLSRRIEGITYIACDFAMSTESHADYSCFIVGDKVGDVTIIRYIDWFKGLGQENQEDKIRELNQIYKPVAVLMDCSGFGKGFVNNLKNEMPVKPMNFDPKNRKEYLYALYRMVEGKRLIIPRNPQDMECMRYTDELIAQVTGLVEDATPTGASSIHSTTTHDDFCAALALLASGVETHGECCDFIASHSRDNVPIIDTSSDESKGPSGRFIIDTRSKSSKS